MALIILRTTRGTFKTAARNSSQLVTYHSPDGDLYLTFLNGAGKKKFPEPPLAVHLMNPKGVALRYVLDRRISSPTDRFFHRSVGIKSDINSDFSSPDCLCRRPGVTQSPREPSRVWADVLKENTSAPCAQKEIHTFAAQCRPSRTLPRHFDASATFSLSKIPRPAPKLNFGAALNHICKYPQSIIPNFFPFAVPTYV